MADKKLADEAAASSTHDDALRAIKFMAIKALIFMVLPAALAVIAAVIVLN